MIGTVARSARLNLFSSRLKSQRFVTTSLFKTDSCLPVQSRGYVYLTRDENVVLKSFTRKQKSFLGEKLLLLDSKRHSSSEQELVSMNFEKISNETLESLSEYFDELIEDASHLQDGDVCYGDGVLTVKFGKEYGTYVINRQVPNLQIWLSSPKSGPKRYDFIDGTWIYKHDGKSMHELLSEEIPDIVKGPVAFDNCSYSTRKK
ncbi:hypothetical protein TKK_0018990 [Trichogramma kaykai]|uniref:ferroxidase n=1 Tax=Trichogramma kaykai TaxID=54128 RepID=A0ABD2VVD8_9HYME